jgi:tyrosyl-tRNA synthetase
LLGKDEVEGIIASHKSNPGARLLQKTLAREVTELIHGRERCESVERVTAVLFGGENFQSLSEADIDELAAEIPTVRKQTVVTALVESEVVASNGEAKRLIEGGGVSVNGQKITDDQDITETSLVKKGKNSFVLVR